MATAGNLTFDQQTDQVPLLFASCGYRTCHRLLHAETTVEVTAAFGWFFFINMVDCEYQYSVCHGQAAKLGIEIITRYGGEFHSHRRSTNCRLNVSHDINHRSIKEYVTSMLLIIPLACIIVKHFCLSASIVSHFWWIDVSWWKT